MQSGQFDPRPVITHDLPLERADEGFKLVTTGGRETGKVILRPGGKS
jgi:threonine dehydrogenase-like Zn-dependent dehydrogenase